MYQVNLQKVYQKLFELLSSDSPLDTDVVISHRSIVSGQRNSWIQGRMGDIAAVTGLLSSSEHYWNGCSADESSGCNWIQPRPRTLAIPPPPYKYSRNFTSFCVIL